MKDTTDSRRPDFPNCRHPLLFVMGLAVLCSACAGPRAVTKTDWLPDSDGWEVRDVDKSEPPRWVVYQRDALEADVKEIRLVGVINAEAQAVATVLRHRLLDEGNVPDGTVRKTLRASDDEVDIYGRTSLPFPFDDREITERFRFSHDERTGVHLVDIRGLEPTGAPKPGTLRVFVHNKYVITPVGEGRSAIIMDSVHDLGGNFPNWALYGMMNDFLIDEHAALNKLSAANQGGVPQ